MKITYNIPGLDVGKAKYRDAILGSDVAVSLASLQGEAHLKTSG